MQRWLQFLKLTLATELDSRPAIRQHERKRGVGCRRFLRHCNGAANWIDMTAAADREDPVARSIWSQAA
jgi:hypothetical protein